MRLLNIVIIAALILAASVVYKIKFDSTLQAERVGKLAGQIRRERDAIAALRAEWARLDTPGRIQGLADRHLQLVPIKPTQFDSLDNLPARPAPAPDDPAGAELPIPTPPAACRRRRDRPMQPAAVPAEPLATPDAQAALRPRRRPQRQGQGPAWPRHRRFRRHLLRDRVASRDVRRGERRPRRPPQRRPGRGRHRAPRYPRPQRPGAGDRREGRLAVCRAAQADRRRRGGRIAHRGAARSRRAPNCATGSPPSAASSGSSARSRRSSSRRCTASAFPASASSPRTSASIRTARSSRTSSGSSTSTTRASPASRSGWTGRGSPTLHMAGLATDRLQRPVKLALDLRVQYALRDELIKAREKFKAKAASGVILDVDTGEIVAMVSVPDYDPNNPREANDPTRINRLTTGVYEMGSTFKSLDHRHGARQRQGHAQLEIRRPRAAPLRQVHHPRFRRRRTASSRCRRCYTYSSNICIARIAWRMGVPTITRRS